MKTLRFGIEIETVGSSKESAARAIASVVGGTARPSVSGGWEVVAADGRTWRAVPDGSLAGFQNAEIVSPILGYDDIEKLQEVIRALHAAGARADASCGIHIHVDGSRFDAKSLTNLVKTIHKQERLIEAALGIQQHRLARYCRPIESRFVQALESRRPRTIAEINTAWYGFNNPRPARYDQTRYHGLNLNSFFFRHTIEFRYFEGTTHAGKVKAYIQFVLALAAKALASHVTTQPQDVPSRLPEDSRLATRSRRNHSDRLLNQAIVQGVVVPREHYVIVGVAKHPSRTEFNERGSDRIIENRARVRTTRALDEEALVKVEIARAKRSALTVGFGAHVEIRANVTQGRCGRTEVCHHAAPRADKVPPHGNVDTVCVGGEGLAIRTGGPAALPRMMDKRALRRPPRQHE